MMITDSPRVHIDVAADVAVLFPTFDSPTYSHTILHNMEVDLASQLFTNNVDLALANQLNFAFDSILHEHRVKRDAPPAVSQAVFQVSDKILYKIMGISNLIFCTNLFSSTSLQKRNVNICKVLE